MSVGNIEELIDDNHAIISSPNGPEYYVNILSFVDKDSIEPGSTVLLHNKVLSVVGLLSDDVDPMVNVMKVEKAPLESYADIGGLQQQIQEVKEAVELPMTHPELYEDIGIKPPKGVIFYGPPGTGPSHSPNPCTTLPLSCCLCSCQLVLSHRCSALLVSVLCRL